MTSQVKKFLLLFQSYTSGAVHSEMKHDSSKTMVLHKDIKLHKTAKN